MICLNNSSLHVNGFFYAMRLDKLLDVFIRGKNLLILLKKR